MKKIRILLLTILLLVPIKHCLADEFEATTTLTCPNTTINPGGTVKCTISATVNKEVTEFRANIDGTDVTVTDWAVATGWVNLNAEHDYSSGRVDAIRETAVNGEITIGEVTIKVNTNTSGNRQIFFKEINYGTSDGLKHTSNTNTVTINVQNNNPTGLSNLEVTGGHLSYQFLPSVLSYNLILPVGGESFSIIPTKADSNDGIEIINSSANDTAISPTNIPFAPAAGQSAMSIKIIVGTGDRKVEYQLFVVRESPDSVGEPTLASLTVGGKAVDVSSENITANLSNVTSYSLTAVLTDKVNYTFSTSNLPSSCTIVDGTLECSLQGENSIPIFVVSATPGGKSKTYIVDIKKGSGGSGGTTPTNPAADPVDTNPQTGSAVAFVMAFVLIVSFAASLYLYKRNMKNFES